MNKGLPLLARTVFAFNGLRVAIASEVSFRTELFAAVMATAATIWLRPGWLWAALIAVAIGLVLALELINTALEHALDGIYPEQAQFIGVAKDCAAAAVLMSSLLAIIIFGFMMLDCFT